ncbi:S28 family serine protease [Fulvitalea axinellae]
MRITNRFGLVSAFLLALAVWACQPKTQEKAVPENLSEALSALPGVVSVKAMDADSLYGEYYEMYFEQPFDHKDTAAGTFRQRVLLGHMGYDRPTVVELQGYNIWTAKAGELSTLLNANQLTIEHRFFKDSAPDSIDWSYLTIEQAATDQHKIIQAVKSIYDQGKWISTGISKGGQTTMIHRRFYPEDVDLSVPYVAPLVFAQEDSRIYEFIDSVGSEECRANVARFQRELLEHKKEVLPLLEAYGKKRGYGFDSLGLAGALDYAALEYPFAFWQWGNTGCEKIPEPGADAETLFTHLRKTVPFSWYDDGGFKSGLPSFYQFSTQLGYYGYRTDGLEDLLTYENPNNQVFAPQKASLVHNPAKMRDLHDWLMKNGSNMLYIYGGYDTWSACAIDLTDSKTNAVKMVNPKATHATRIKHFSEDDKRKIYATLESWLGFEIPEENKEKLKVLQ